MCLRCEIGCEIAEGMDPEKKGRKMRKVKLVTKLIINRMEIAAIIATSAYKQIARGYQIKEDAMTNTTKKLTKRRKNEKRRIDRWRKI